MGFLLSALRSLDEELRRLGRPLVVRRGEPLLALQQIREEADAGPVFAQADSSPYAQRRDSRVASQLPVEWTGTSAIRPPGSVLKADGDPYVVYSPFRDRWEEGDLPRPEDLLPPPTSLPAGPQLAAEAVPDDPPHEDTEGFPASESAARKRLHQFVAGDRGLQEYADMRDRVDMAGTSRLSPYLRFGLLSPREVFVTAQARLSDLEDASERRGARTWLDEMIWRDFYLHILHFFPQARLRSFRAKYRGLPWQNDEAAFEAWKAGQTGYPFVDAAMRQLFTSGWMHNRARMVTASFLVKDLLIDWRWGERYFMQQLLDGDPASNNGGWQWAAGTGTDAAPYFRIFNPIRQGEKHDPEGRYIRRWLPELEGVPDKFIHEPWKMSPAEQRKASCLIGEDYPEPIVDHGQARERALHAYRSMP